MDVGPNRDTDLLLDLGQMAEPSLSRVRAKDEMEVRLVYRKDDLNTVGHAERLVRFSGGCVPPCPRLSCSSPAEHTVPAIRGRRCPHCPRSVVRH